MKFAIYGPHYDISGYGNVCRNIIIELIKMNINFGIIKYNDVGIIPDEIDKGILQEIKKREFDIEILPKNIPILCITVPDVIFADERIIDKQHKLILFSMYEIDTIPDIWVKGINKFISEAWVPSKFNYETYKNSGVNKKILKIMPLGVDVEKFKPNKNEILDLDTEKKFKFLSMFQFTYRKGYDVLIKAFTNEFSRDEDVCLIIKTYEGNFTVNSKQVIFNEMNRLINEKHNPILPKIYLILDKMEEERILKLHNSCNCYISTSRGEGFNLPLIESLACEKPAIVSNYSAHLDFCNRKTSYLINTKKTKISKEMSWVHYGYENGTCREPDVKHTMKLMRHVFENYKGAKLIGKNARKFLIDNEFTWKDCAGRIITRLQELIT